MLTGVVWLEKAKARYPPEYSNATSRRGGMSNLKGGSVPLNVLSSCARMTKPWPWRRIGCAAETHRMRCGDVAFQVRQILARDDVVDVAAIIVVVDDGVVRDV